MLVASVGTVPSSYRTSLDLYLSVYIDGAVNGIWLLDIHWARSQNCEKGLLASSGPTARPPARPRETTWLPLDGFYEIVI